MAGGGSESDDSSDDEINPFNNVVINQVINPELTAARARLATERNLMVGRGNACQRRDDASNNWDRLDRFLREQERGGVG